MNFQVISLKNKMLMGGVDIFFFLLLSSKKVIEGYNYFIKVKVISNKEGIK